MADCYVFVCPDHDEVQVSLETLYICPEGLEFGSPDPVVHVSVAALCPFCYRALAVGEAHIELKEV